MATVRVTKRSDLKGFSEQAKAQLEPLLPPEGTQARGAQTPWGQVAVPDATRELLMAVWLALERDDLQGAKELLRQHVGG